MHTYILFFIHIYIYIHRITGDYTSHFSVLSFKLLYHSQCLRVEISVKLYILVYNQHRNHEFCLSGAKNMFIILILNHINVYQDFQYQISKIVLAIFKLKLELKQKV